MATVTLRKSKIKKFSTREELESLERENLVDRILQLEAHNSQLKDIISKQSGEKIQNSSVKRKKAREFDFSKWHKRHILLKFYYLGWDYQGFASQEDTTNTIEQHIFAALIKGCLIESRESSNYHRCGRTDKGVSAFSQVISLDIRSKLSPENESSLREELQYCKLLNRLLPSDIRCISWCPASNDLSARFDCKNRTYKYFFPRGNLKIDDMNKALKYIIGTHDFRNICKMDVSNGVISFIRTILDADISLCHKDTNLTDNSGYDVCRLTITGQAYLWHQIRCIMGVLFLVGQGKEKPEVFLELFDIEKHPEKPQYNLAHEVPLNLFYCKFENEEWFVDQTELTEVIKTLQQHWTLHTVKTAMMREMLADLESKLEHGTEMNFQSDCLVQGVRSRVYQPLMERKTCKSLESRIDHYVKKRRLEVKNDGILKAAE